MQSPPQTQVIQRNLHAILYKAFTYRHYTQIIRSGHSLKDRSIKEWPVALGRPDSVKELVVVGRAQHVQLFVLLARDRDRETERERQRHRERQRQRQRHRHTERQRARDRQSACVCVLQRTAEQPCSWHSATVGRRTHSKGERDTALRLQSCSEAEARCCKCLTESEPR